MYLKQRALEWHAPELICNTSSKPEIERVRSSSEEKALETGFVGMVGMIGKRVPFGFTSPPPVPIFHWQRADRPQRTGVAVADY